MACSSFSSARYVRSMTAPVRKFLSLVRTNAPPLPGFTCWNSTTVMSPSGRFRAMPFLRSFVEMLTRTASGFALSRHRRPVRDLAGAVAPDCSRSGQGSDHELLGELGEGLGPPDTHHD